MSSSSARSVELVALTPLGTIPGILAIAVALALLMWHRGAARWVPGMALVVAMPALAVHLAWIGPLFVGPKPTADRSKQIVVMAQNFEYGDSGDLIDRMVNNHTDLLVISDMRQENLQGLRAGGISRYLPYHIGVTPDGPQGTVVYSRYPLVGDTLISDGGDLRAVTVKHTPLGDVRLFALHPTPPYQRAAWAREYVWIDRALARWARESPKTPTLIAGDLNATLDHAELRLIANMGYSDAMVQANGGLQPTFPAPGTRKAWGLPIPAIVPIDHVMVSHPLVVTSAKTLTTVGADHLGLLVRVGKRA